MAKASRQDRLALIGMGIGMAIAAFVAIMFAYESSSVVRYLIMATGLVVGWAAGRFVGRGDG